MNSYFNTENDSFTLYEGDCIECLNHIDKQVDMIFADPPYFLSKGVRLTINGKTKSFDKGDWDRANSYDDISAFNYQWISQCRKVLKDSGTIWISGTFHNIFLVANTLVELGFKILNVIVWQKSDPRPTLSSQYFSFTSEYIVWARKSENISHYFNCDLMTQLNGGARMPDVWRIPILSSCELKFGGHPTQKPLRLLYRIITSSSREGDLILDPFAGSCTTGIAAFLLKRKFIGIEKKQEYLELGVKRYQEVQNESTKTKLLGKISECSEEIMVMVNHARNELREKMIKSGVCYLRAGDSKGSLLVSPGFERLNYVLLHTNGESCQLFKLKTKGHFQIWTKDTLVEYGFEPTHAPYYIVLLFDNIHQITITRNINVKEKGNTFRAKIRPLSDFIGIK